MSGDLPAAAANCGQAAALARRAGDARLLAEVALALEGVGDASVSLLIAETSDEALARLDENVGPAPRSRLLSQRAAAAHYLLVLGEIGRLLEAS